MPYYQSMTAEPVSMPQNNLNEILVKFRQRDASIASGKPLAELEALFNYSRSYEGNFAEFIKELVQCSDWKNRSEINYPYPKICCALAKQIDQFFNSTSNREPFYHSRKHFQDVCLALTVLLIQSKKTIDQLQLANHWKISDEDAWLLLFCAIAHDYGHDGSFKNPPFKLENYSILLTQDFLETQKATLEISETVNLENQIKPIILATAPSYLQTLLTKFDSPNELTKTDCLCMLMVEADLLASSLPTYGQYLGRLLAQEWQLEDLVASEFVVSRSGRLKFLNQINFISPYAKILGLDVIRVESIKQLEEMKDAK